MSLVRTAQAAYEGVESFWNGYAARVPAHLRSITKKDVEEAAFSGKDGKGRSPKDLYYQAQQDAMLARKGRTKGGTQKTNDKSLIRTAQAPYEIVESIWSEYTKWVPAHLRSVTKSDLDLAAFQGKDSLGRTLNDLRNMAQQDLFAATSIPFKGSLAPGSKPGSKPGSQPGSKPGSQPRATAYSADVAKLQTAINKFRENMGLSSAVPLKVDGIMGPKTFAALKSVGNVGQAMAERNPDSRTPEKYLSTLQNFQNYTQQQATQDVAQLTRRLEMEVINEAAKQFTEQESKRWLAQTPKPQAAPQAAAYSPPSREAQRKALENVYYHYGTKNGYDQSTKGGKDQARRYVAMIMKNPNHVLHDEMKKMWSDLSKRWEAKLKSDSAKGVSPQKGYTKDFSSGWEARASRKNIFSKRAQEMMPVPPDPQAWGGNILVAADNKDTPATRFVKAFMQGTTPHANLDAALQELRNYLAARKITPPTHDSAAAAFRQLASGTVKASSVKRAQVLAPVPPDPQAWGGNVLAAADQRNTPATRFVKAFMSGGSGSATELDAALTELAGYLSAGKITQPTHDAAATAFRQMASANKAANQTNMVAQKFAQKLPLLVVAK